MNVPRYIIAGGASIMLHAAFLFVAQESKVFAMPAGSQSTSVSINFVASTSASPTPPKVAEVATDTPPAPKTSPVQKKTTKAKPITKTPTPTKQNKNIKKISKQKPLAQKPLANEKSHKAKVANAKPIEEITPPTTKDETIKEPEKVQQQAPAQMVNSGVSNTPVLIQKPNFARKPSPPRYPRMARKRGIEGVATYEIWLDKEGKQIKQALVDSSGALMLDKAALDAIKKWKFSAHTVNGQAIAHRIQIPVRFKLD